MKKLFTTYYVKIDNFIRSIILSLKNYIITLPIKDSSNCNYAVTNCNYAVTNCNYRVLSKALFTGNCHYNVKMQNNLTDSKRKDNP